MTQTEYEQKKQECWEEFKNAAFNGNTSYSTCSALDFAFDRAYALGKQKEAITQGQIEKAAEEHADELRVSSAIHGALVPMLHDIAKSSYLQGAQDFIGKQEKDAEKPKEKLMCLRDRTKVCNKCHACDIDTDAWHSMYSR